MPNWILLALFIFVVIWPASRYGVFLLSSFRAGSLAEIRKSLGGLRRPLLRGWMTAIMAELIAIPSYPAGLFLGRGKPGKGTPVVLVHGLFHNSSAWLIMKPRLNRAGFTNLHTYQYNSFSKGFPEAVDGLRNTLERILADHPGEKVILVGHSLGGLVCRCVAGEEQFAGRVAGLVALGSPHHGSDLAWFGGNRMSRGLIPGRSIGKAVAAVKDPDCPRLAIYNLVDDFVFPLSMLKPDRPGWEERLCSPMAHVWMLYSREVTGMVENFLRRIDPQQ